MQRRWKFDENNPYEDSFEEALLKTVNSKPVFDMIQRKLLDIQKAPTQNPFGLVRGKVVYISKTGPVRFPGIEVEPLLIVYALKHREHLIQRVFVCRAADWVDDNARGDQITRALRPAIERALANMGHKPPAAPQATSNGDRRRRLRFQLRELGHMIVTRNREEDYRAYVTHVVATGDSATVIVEEDWLKAAELDRDIILISYYLCLSAELVELARRLEVRMVSVEQRWERFSLSSEMLAAAARRDLERIESAGTLFVDEIDEDFET